jgi:hypothetical protein
MLCTQFYCNAPTHQESVWIHISVVSRSHFVITPSQSKSICPPLNAVTYTITKYYMSEMTDKEV